MPRRSAGRERLSRRPRSPFSTGLGCNFVRLRMSRASGGYLGSDLGGGGRRRKGLCILSGFEMTSCLARSFAPRSAGREVWIGKGLITRLLHVFLPFGCIGACVNGSCWRGV